MNKLFFAVIVIFSFLLISCSTSVPYTNLGTGGDSDTAKPNDNVVVPDTTQNDGNVTQDTAGTDGTTQTDGETNDENSGVKKVGDSCQKDMECGAPLICVSAKCAEGCASDTDCTAYKGTRCNTKLGRCLNVAASSQACGEAKCATGCCYAAKGFISLSCAKTPDLKICGICKQGEVYMDGKTCIPAACDSSSDKCSTYNSSDAKSKCFQCKSGELVCYLNESTCKTGSGLLINAAQCVPAGETCTVDGASCCSGQPCIQGYCY